LQEINTPRLILRLMTEEFLEASLDENYGKAESLIGLKISPDWFDEKDLAKIRLGDYRADPNYISWGLRGIGLKSSNEMVGYICFHTSPNPKYLRKFAPQAAEFGYTIFFNYRRQGFAQEAAAGLMNWAKEQYPLENFIISVSPTNPASTAIAKKLNFEPIGEQIDEIDGLEIVYRLSVEKHPLLSDFPESR
jgi:RimJ/RimL family protein N-acetyltransferase